MSKWRVGRLVLPVAALAGTVFSVQVGCNNDLSTKGRSSAPQQGNTARYELQAPEATCITSRWMFQVDESTPQYDILGSVSLVGCREDIEQLTDAQKLGVEAKLKEVVSEQPLRLAALCWSADEIRTKAALEAMTEFRVYLLERLNSGFDKPMITSVVCSLYAVEKL